MARKKRSPQKRTSRRRRSVRGVDMNNILMSFGGVLAGVAAAGYANKLVLKNQSKTIQSMAPIALGVLLPMVIKSDIGKYAGLGMFAYGGIKILQNAGLGEIAGLGDDDGQTITISGDDLSTISGDLTSIAGGYDNDEFAMAGNDEDFAMAGNDDDEEYNF